MRPTSLGAKALAFVGIVWLAFFATPYSNLYFLWLCLFLALAVVAAVTTVQNVRGVRAELAQGAGVAADAPVELLLLVQSAPRRGRGLRLELRVDGRHVEAAAFDAPDVPSSLPMLLPALPRGVHRVTRAALVSSAPFGLCRARRPIRAPRELVVPPRPLPIERLSCFAARACDREAEVSGLRAYRPGDDPREIHARASARRGAPIVREREPAGATGIVVALDRRCDAALL